jgi:GrpB-like predicted nucleotidyltransferase (UPF0157 family)
MSFVVIVMALGPLLLRALADHLCPSPKHPEDRERYAAVKREAAAASREAGETVQDYNLRKEFVIREILDRAFRAEGLLQ